MVDDFSKQFGLPKPGETGTVAATGPENHEIEKVRGAKLTITFAVDRVDRITPAEVADVVKAFGFEGEDQLKDAIRHRLLNRVMVEQHSAMRQQAAAHLLENTQVDLPQRLTAQQAARTLERQRLELMYRGVEPTVIEERLADLRAASGRMAVQELKLFFILHQVAEELKVRVDEAEVNGRIAQLAMERNARPEALRQELIQKNQIGMVVQQVREHKTFDAIIAKAKVTEVPVDEFNKAMGGGAKKKKEAPADEDDKPKAGGAAKKKGADDDDKPAASRKKKDDDDKAEKPAKKKK
jgi:FKBP-type peptidyl-prolyl cis-trans isomerase (trigger factor)